MFSSDQEFRIGRGVSRQIRRGRQADESSDDDESASRHINPPEPPVPARQPQPFNYIDLRNARLEFQRLVDRTRTEPPLEGNAADVHQQLINQQHVVVARLEQQQREVAAEERQRLEREHQQRVQRQRDQERELERELEREQQRAREQREQQLAQQQREQQLAQQQREQKLPDREAKVVLSTIEDKINHFQKKHQECQLLMNEQNKLLKDIVDQTNNEQEARNDKETCKVCMTNKRSHVVLPCGHYCLCEVCAEEINKTTRKCPICRAVNVRFNKLYENKYLKYKMKYLKLKK
jgi:hypothetical protein